MDKAKGGKAINVVFSVMLMIRCGPREGLQWKARNVWAPCGCRTWNGKPGPALLGLKRGGDTPKSHQYNFNVDR